MFDNEFGKPAKYTGGGELCKNHKKRYEEDRRVIKQFAAAGINLRRENAATVHKIDLLSRVPYQQSRYKQQKFVPSVARRLQHDDATKIGGFLAMKLGRDDQGNKVDSSVMLKHYTVSALDENPIFGDPEYRENMQKSRKALSKTIRALEDIYGLDGFEVIMIREEETLDTSKRKLFAHYHILAIVPTCPRISGYILRDFKDISRSYVHCSVVKCKKQTANYVSKPLAIPADMQPEDLRWYYEATVNRRKVVRRGSFQAWLKLIEQIGKLVKIDGYFTIVRGNRPFEDENVDNMAPRDAQLAQEGPLAVLATDSAAEPEARERSAKSPENLFCGVTVPRPNIGNIKTSYALMQNYNPTALFASTSEGLHDLRRAQMLAIEIYERNTGKKFCLREYLKPQAKAIYKRMTDECDIYRSTISVPDNVKAIVLELLNIDPDEFDSPPPTILETSDPPF